MARRRLAGNARVFFWIAVALLPAWNALAGDGGGLLGTYYADSEFRTFTYHQIDPEINFDWKEGGPADIGANNFSIRWVGHVVPEFTEEYTFTTATDDGVRLWVDYHLLVDEWHPQAIAEHSGTVELEAGKPYAIQIDYFERSGSAAAKLYWSSPSQPKSIIPSDRLVAPALGQGYLAQYFASPELNGSSRIHLDEAINFKAGNHWPPVDARNGFSARWTAKIVPRYSEDYTFKILAAGGVRVYLNGEKIMDRWERHPLMTDSTIAECTAQRLHDLIVEFHGADQDCIRLLWSSESQEEEMVPSSALMPVGTGTGFKAEIFADPELSDLITTRTDATIDFSFSAGEPRAEGLTSDTFSGRWTGWLVPLFSEPYTFAVRADDGIRLWINDHNVIDNWQPGLSVNRGTVELEAGKPVAFKLEYFDSGGDAILGVKWASPHQLRRLITPRLVYQTDN